MVSREEKDALCSMIQKARKKLEAAGLLYDIHEYELSWELVKKVSKILKEGVGE